MKAAEAHGAEAFRGPLSLTDQVGKRPHPRLQPPGPVLVVKPLPTQSTHSASVSARRLEWLRGRGGKRAAERAAAAILGKGPPKGRRQRAAVGRIYSSPMALASAWRSPPHGEKGLRGPNPAGVWIFGRLIYRGGSAILYSPVWPAARLSVPLPVPTEQGGAHRQPFVGGAGTDLEQPGARGGGPCGGLKAVRTAVRRLWKGSVAGQGKGSGKGRWPVKERAVDL